MPEPINCVRTGSGSPVVLLHPVGLDLTYWAAQIDALRADHEVVAFDLPGHGRTPGTPADITMDTMAAVTARVIEDHGFGTAHVVGLSVGGIIAQALVLARPELVRSLTLVNTAATFADDVRPVVRGRADTVRAGGMAATLEPSIARWFTPETRRDRPDIIDRVEKTLLGDDPAVHAAMWEMVAAIHFTPDLHRVSCPALVLVGEDDPSTPPSTAAVVRDAIPGAELRVIKGASHMAHLEKPGELTAEIAPFLAKVDAAG